MTRILFALLPMLIATLIAAAQPQPVEGTANVILRSGKPQQPLANGWQQRDGSIEGAGKIGLPIMTDGLASGDFHIRVRLRMFQQKASAASFYLDNNHFGFEGASETIYLAGPIFGGKVSLLAPATDVFERGAWIDFDVIRNGKQLHFLINDKVIHATDDGGREYNRIGLSPFRSTMQVSDISVVGKLKDVPQPLPFVDVFVAGQEYPSFRIPSIVVSNQKTLLAFVEGRDKHSDHAANDIVLKRSTDGGKTWGKLITVAEDGQNSLNNPQAVVVPDSGRILLMYQRYPKGIHEGAVQPGYEGPRICRNFLTHSDDDGLTWSKPRDVTSTTKREKVVTSIASGPGIGILLTRGEHKGRILMPMNQGPFGKWKVYATFSDDGGDTWTFGDVAPDGEKGVGNEVQMVELADGSVMLNSRTQGGNRVRKFAFSDDGGQTWSPLKDDRQLPEPQCQGTILRYDWPKGDRPGHILFANPATKSGRTLGTIKISTDDGKTWSDGKLVYPGGFAYSCLTNLPGGDVGLLFERDGYAAVSFMRVVFTSLESSTRQDTPQVLP